MLVLEGKKLYSKGVKTSGIKAGSDGLPQTGGKS
jgi:hypothetical protein